MEIAPLVSILMSIYREDKEIADKAVCSILNQTYRNIQIIIILDNPQNILVKDYLTDMANHDHRIIFLVNDTNLGLAESLNRGLQFADGKYIARMDADDISDLKRIERQVEYMERNNTDLIGMAIQPIDQFDQPIGGVIMYPQSDFFIRKLLQSKSCIAHPTWMMKKEVMIDLNGYRNLEASQDYDFLIRALERGYTFGNVKECGLFYRKSEQTISCKNKETQLLIFNYIRKNRNATLQNFDVYKKSNDGKRDLEDIRRYFRCLEKFKDYRGKKCFMRAGFTTIYLVLCTSRAKIVIKNYFMLKFFLLFEDFIYDRRRNI